MATSTTASCPHECVFTNDQLSELLDINCRLKRLTHSCQCSSARSRGDVASPCHKVGQDTEVTPERMNSILDEIAKSVETLRGDYKVHAELHAELHAASYLSHGELQEMRANPGRGLRDGGRDSGYVSQRISVPPNIPKEQAGAVAPTGTREAAEHKEEPSNTFL